MLLMIFDWPFSLLFIHGWPWYYEPKSGLKEYCEKPFCYNANDNFYKNHIHQFNLVHILSIF